MALGIPNELYWDLTPHELGVILTQKQALAKEAWLQAGLVAAVIVNVNRKPGAALVQPSDFFREPRNENDFMSAEEGALSMDRWAASVNANHPPAKADGGAES